MERIEGKGKETTQGGNGYTQEGIVCSSSSAVAFLPFYIHQRWSCVCVCGKCPPVRSIRVRLCGEKTRRSGIGPAADVERKRNEKKGGRLCRSKRIKTKKKDDALFLYHETKEQRTRFVVTERVLHTQTGRSQGLRLFSRPSEKIVTYHHQKETKKKENNYYYYFKSSRILPTTFKSIAFCCCCCF